MPLSPAACHSCGRFRSFQLQSLTSSFLTNRAVMKADDLLRHLQRRFGQEFRALQRRVDLLKNQTVADSGFVVVGRRPRIQEQGLQKLSA